MKIKEVRIPGEKKARARALLLLSGGLDSVLAGKVLEEQGVEVVAVTFRSLFFGPREAIRAAEEQGWPLLVVDITEEEIQIVEKPKYGYGRNMNPCIDCHGQMVRLAGELLERYEADFVATGEVLGERPKSQNRQALGIVEKLSGLKGLVLRPLSAKLLPPTKPEEQGLVDRERLLDISGRSRKKQMEMAAKYGIKEYPTPAGGCLLTDPTFSDRLKKLLNWRGRLLADDIRLIKNGRVFFEDDGIIAVGRDERDNEKVRKSVLDSDIIVTTAEVKGPLTVVRLKGWMEWGRPHEDKERAESEADDAAGRAGAGEMNKDAPGEGTGNTFKDFRQTGSSIMVSERLDYCSENKIRGQEPGVKKEGIESKSGGWAVKGGDDSGQGNLDGRSSWPSHRSQVFNLPVVRKAALLTIRYSKAKIAEEAAVIMCWKEMKEVRKFKKEEWEQYL